jgi:hypothetical protein
MRRVSILWSSIILIALFNISVGVSDLLLKRNLLSNNEKARERFCDCVRNDRECFLKKIEERHRSEYASFESLAMQMAAERQKTRDLGKKLQKLPEKK